MKRFALLLALSLFFASGPAFGRVERFAVIVGNDAGQNGDMRLRYAETDSAKVFQVLRDLGGFHPANMVLLRGEDASTFRSTLISMNDRVRAAASLPDTQTLLFVYYSGHADAAALRLGESRFETDELGKLVRGSSATFRLLVVDACRSGTFTRVKGGRIMPAFALPGERSLGGEGLAFLTASSANEDAQESDELKGSFFTHALVSGLLGAADTDGDGAVVLEEAYRYAYQATLRATSKTWAGTQHPTFQYDLRGQAALVLTRLVSGKAPRAMLELPPGVGFLVLREHGDGAVIGEVGPRDPARALSLRPGRYFLRGRGDDVLLEGEVTLAAGQRHVVDSASLRRVAYARLVRKGERPSEVAHGPEIGAAVRSRLPGADTPCAGVAGGYRVELEHLTLQARVGACTSSFENTVVSATTNELDASMAALHAWDFPWVSLAVGLGAGAAFTFQQFETRGEAPDRESTAPFVFAVGSATFDLTAAWFAALDARAETHFIDLQAESDQASSMDPAFGVRGTLLTGALF